jgi:hypothetical protein
VGVIPDATLLEISVVYTGAQQTSITSVKQSTGTNAPVTEWWADPAPYVYSAPVKTSAEAKVETPNADALVAATKAEMAAERQAAAEQAAFEQAMNHRASGMAKSDPEPVKQQLTAFAAVLADPDAERLKEEAEQREAEQAEQLERERQIDAARRTEGRWEIH